MKNILIILGIVTFIWTIVLFASCNDNPNSKTVVRVSPYGSGVDTFNLYGHSYIQFDKGTSSTWGVHNPDCLKCKKEKQ